ncbi:hypothetical protein M2444_003380 [Paenibacillus sp. PastF-3]|uniref:hypothetical protein n=1 Tax=unclassified Paenibacillus TaxID=185978 RepID=UPI000BA1646F|nr:MULTISPECIES: hypothetical protein [unclassified Paenibacillus]MDH6371581.1 hypothetical protein [Paenibacillus sp. PastF-3]OZQ83675.1 hypothetical protein CA598_23855 [Paenibacillus sp. VTT E-133291]
MNIKKHIQKIIYLTAEGGGQTRTVLTNRKILSSALLPTAIHRDPDPFGGRISLRCLPVVDAGRQRRLPW